MKETFVWIKNNLSHMFSIIGIILTIYFSVFYVPKYSEDIKIRRIDAANQEIISTIQELVYNKHDVNERNIKTLIKGKEIKGNISYPFNVDDLLIQVQENFLSNKFIPLDQRKDLVDRVDKIRESINSSKSENIEIETEEKIDWYSIGSTLFAVLGVIISVMGASSLATTTKKIKDEEVESRVSEETDNFQERLKKALALEDTVENILKNKFGNDNVQKDVRGNIGVDFLVDLKDGRKIGFEVKTTDAEIVPLRLISIISSRVKMLKFPIVLLSNGELSHNAKRRIEFLNTSANEWERIYFSSIKNIEEFLSSEFK